MNYFLGDVIGRPEMQQAYEIGKMENVFKGINLLKKASYVRKGEDDILVDDDDGPYEMALLLCFDDVYRVAGKKKMKKGKTLNVKES